MSPASWRRCATAISPSWTRTANTAAWSAAATSSRCASAASSWWTTTRPRRPWKASIRPKFWRSSTTTASAVWRPAARSTSATSPWAARPPSSPRCTTRTAWRSPRRPPVCCWRPSCRTRWCSAAPPAPRWTRPPQSVWPRSPGWRSTPLPMRCSKPVKSWTARPPRKCSCRTSRCSCAAISASAWHRAAI